MVSGKRNSVNPTVINALPIMTIGTQGANTSLRTMSCGAKRLPTRALKPRIPMAVPRTTVGNSSTLYRFMPQNKETASPLANRASATKMVSVDE